MAKIRPKTTAPGRVADPLPAGCKVLLSRAQVCQALGGISSSLLDKWIASGVFPKADHHIGDGHVKRRLPRWKSDTINTWIEELPRGGCLPTR